MRLCRPSWIVLASFMILAASAAKAEAASETPLDCLAKAVYFEAKGESTEAMRATAAVVVNRTKNPEFPDSVCGVVHEETANACQFGWYCDGKPDRPTEAGEWQRAIEVAKAALAGKSPDPTGGALYFHAAVAPTPWTIERQKTATIGPFVYYKETAEHAVKLAKERARENVAE
ncbi:MAG: cell wall hydrolase [Geminicoccaceae bacterium]|nr:cell wall hydrolase [Geminicoccaceae bacterium]